MSIILGHFTFSIIENVRDFLLGDPAQWESQKNEFVFPLRSSSHPQSGLHQKLPDPLVIFSLTPFDDVMDDTIYGSSLPNHET